MRFEIDREARAAYLHLRDGKVARQILVFKQSVIVDIDDRRRWLGVEILFPERKRGQPRV